jgi:HD superfamily phosphodiesterase
VHDIGKIENDNNHAELGVKILEKEFKLNEVDRDCILNHGSSRKPRTDYGKIFRYADGISLFYPEMIKVRIEIEQKNGMKLIDIKKNIAKIYQKYLEAYSDSKEAIWILNKNYGEFLQRR